MFPPLVMVDRFAPAVTDPEVAVRANPEEPALWSAADVVIDAQVTERFPPTVIWPEGLVKAPDPPHVNVTPLVELTAPPISTPAAEVTTADWLLF